METAALPKSKRLSYTVSGIGGRVDLSSPRLWLAALALLAAAAVTGFFVRPTYPNYDSYYSLVWGRDLLHGHLPNFDVYRGPTEHPLAVVFGALLSLFGTDGDRLLVLATLLAFVGLVAGVFRVGQRSFSPLVGLLAALLVLTRFDFPFLAIRAYVDVPYMALVVLAAALEVARPRRGPPVMALLTAAGLLRPEGWVLAGLYFLYIAWGVSWSTRIAYAALAALAPVIWLGSDWISTGDSLFSLHATRELAGELDRQRPIGEVPALLVQFFNSTVKLPVAVLGGVGLVIGLLRFFRLMLVPVALLLGGVATFFVSAAVGLSAIPRYLLVPSIALCLFAALAVAGFAVEPRPRYWRVWAGVSALAVALGGIYTAINAPVLSKFDDEIAFQGDIHRSIRKTLAVSAVGRAIDRCGPVTVPTHKFIPDVLWVLDLPPEMVFARSQRISKHGVAIYVFGRKASGRYGDSVGVDPLATSVPAAGYRPIAASRAQYTVAYVSCPPGKAKPGQAPGTGQ